MSRLSDILGVKEGQEFRFDDEDTIYKIIDYSLYYYRETVNIWSIYSGFVIYDMIDHTELIKIVPEKITLTEQQITAIKGRIAEGTPWATKDKDNDKQTWFFETKPTYSAEGIFQPSEDGNIASIVNTPLYDFVTFENSPIYLPDLIKE